MVSQNVAIDKPPVTVPTPRGYPLVGVMPKILGNPLQFLTDTMREYRDIVRLNLGLASIYVVNHPDLVQHVFKENYRNYGKGKMWEPIRALTGAGLAVTEGDAWLQRRRLMQPSFHRERLAALMGIMNDVLTNHMAAWDEVADKGEPVDMLDQMLHLGLKQIVRTMFSVSITEEDTDILCQEFAKIASLVMIRMFTSFLPDAVPRPGDKRFKAGVRTADEIVYRIIKQRRESGEDNEDLLSLLMNARDADTGETMNDKQLRDELITIMMAGHETSATSLAWTCYLISQDAEVEATFHAELKLVLDGRPAEFEDLPKLTYTKMIVDESLRLYPPVWPIPRVTLGEDNVGGYRVPANATVLISPFVVHRHPDFWPDPEKFDPERFAPSKSESLRSRFAYIPFGAGPHMCIGNHLSIMQAQLTLAMIHQKYKLRVVPGHQVVPQSSATTKPRGGLPMTISRR
jgi:cytochrome P450